MHTYKHRARVWGAVVGILMMTRVTGGSPALEIKHPVYGNKIVASQKAQYEAAAQRVLAMSDEELLSFVPPHGYISFCECPHCYGGVEGNGVLTWTFDRPDELTCRFCGKVAFPTKEFPENRELVGKNGLGEEIRIPYYLNEKRDTRHFFTGFRWKAKRAWVLSQCLNLGRAYQTTKDEKYARPVALVLDHIEQSYLHYPAMRNRFIGSIRFCKSQEPPYVWDAGRWNFFHCEIPKTAIACYDMVCESEEFDKLSVVRGYDVRQKFEDDFLRETYRIAHASTFVIGNVVGYDIAGMAILGRVINEPAYVHESVRRIMRNVNEGFFRDGNWAESPSYHYMTIGGLQSAFRVVSGYSDPPGYVDAIDGMRFDDFDPRKDIPFFARAQHAPSALDFPNGCSTAVHDTWPNQKRSKPRDKTVSTIAPAYGHASLGRGQGTDQMQAQLHFGGAYGHAHYDNLNLTLFAKEREMLPDLGYTWTQGRCWTTNTVGHNTVVVDRENQQVGRGKSDGDLLRYFPDLQGFSLVEADGQRGYKQTEGPDAYRRLLLTIPVSDADAYVVDIFRVRGGKIHDWALHGDANEDTAATCSLALAGNRPKMLEPGEAWREPTAITSSFNPYGMIRDVRNAETDGAFQVDFAYEEDLACGLRTHIDAGQCEVFLGRAPSIRRMGTGTKGDMRKLYDFWMPQLLVRRRGEAPLHSVFTAVHEPFRNQPFLVQVERLALVEPDENVVVLRITHAAGIDTIIHTVDLPPYPPRRTVDGIVLR
ncbi:MAG: heparinase II/III family protein, partial [Lentisphaeria bacterium]|nr:heparinase II/III family protein [Lentisphaeria bacterium]